LGPKVGFTGDREGYSVRNNVRTAPGPLISEDR
jgi:hypothetical protein